MKDWRSRVSGFFSGLGPLGIPFFSTAKVIRGARTRSICASAAPGLSIPALNSRERADRRQVTSAALLAPDPCINSARARGAPNRTAGQRANGPRHPAPYRARCHSGLGSRFPNFLERLSRRTRHDLDPIQDHSFLALPRWCSAHYWPTPRSGTLSASPNPSTTGSYIVSEESPPTLPADRYTGLQTTRYYYGLRETGPFGFSQTYNLGRSSASRSFTGQLPGMYVYRLKTCVSITMLSPTPVDEFPEPDDCNNVGDSLSVTVDLPPSVDAGERQKVAEGASVELEGTVLDLGSEALSYSWSQDSETPEVMLSGADTATASFTAPTQLVESVDLVFSLEVSDGLSTVSDTVTVTVVAGLNDAPTAEAGDDQGGVQEGAAVTLDGTGSSDPESEALSYEWSLEDAVVRTGATPSYPAPTQLVEDEVLEFSLVVRDARGLASTAADTVTVTVKAGPNDAPTAHAGDDQGRCREREAPR